MTPTEQPKFDKPYQLFVATTSTFVPPTKRESIDEIVFHAVKLANMKWWQDGSYHKRKIRWYEQFIVD